ncbi:alpha/beta hydrolase family esterase [Plantibacter sp. YIM 135249]|uniref:alpha/beta hydrolase family esterase n=1 Tax=Plantibacter sp. YIM 135249 TaxID=3423918 RepID=UPI003D34E41D
MRPPVGREDGSVVLAFHGSNQTGAILRSFAGGTFDRFAGGFGAAAAGGTAAGSAGAAGSTAGGLVGGGSIVVYLDGHKRHWNDARRSSDFAARRDGMDDTAFTIAVVDRLRERFGIDPARVYAIGFSNGGQMVIRLAHEIPDRLAGIAIVSVTQSVPAEFAPGPVPSRDGGLPGAAVLSSAAVPPADVLAPAHPHSLPTILFHGTADPLVPYGGGMASLWGFRPRGLGMSAPETAAYFAERNGFPVAGVGSGASGLPGGVGGVPTTSAVDAPGRSRTSIVRTDYRADGLQPVTLVTIEGGGHVVPNPKRAPRIMGRSTDRLVAADWIAAFFGLLA